MCLGKRVLGATIAIAAALGCAGYVLAQTASRKSALTIEQLIEIKHPSDPVWSPDNKHVLFTWDRADIKNLYVRNADGSGAPIALTSFPEGGVAGAFWSEDRESVYFVHEGDLWKVPAAGGEAKPAWSKPDRGSGFVPSPDAKRVVYRMWNEEEHGLRVLNMEDSSVTKRTNDYANFPRWSPYGKYLVFSTGRFGFRDEGGSMTGFRSRTASSS